VRPRCAPRTGSQKQEENVVAQVGTASCSNDTMEKATVVSEKQHQGS
jgi:hypothetical protein